MIEALINELIGSIKENTQALRDVLAASGTTPAPVETPKRGKAKSITLTKDPEPVATPEPASEPETETAPVLEIVEPETDPAPAPDWDRTTYLLNITEFVKGRLVADGTGAVKSSYEKIRETFGVKKAPDLADDQLVGFWNAIQSL